MVAEKNKSMTFLMLWKLMQAEWKVKCFSHSGYYLLYLYIFAKWHKIAPYRINE